MKALITGASSGIGRDIAREFCKYGYDLVLVARRKNRLEELKKEFEDLCLKNNIEIIATDLSSTFNCIKLYEKLKSKNIDIVINNAGFGLTGEFTETNLDRELDMIDLNIKSVHVLTKCFVKDFKEKNFGYILNVASIAAFQPGPLMATYYATKAYVHSMTMAINQELKKENSNVYIGCLCPGPVNTEFSDVANVQFAISGLSSEYVASYAVKKMLKRKKVIIPGWKIKCTYFLSKLSPLKLKLAITYKIQKSKIN